MIIDFGKLADEAGLVLFHSPASRIGDAVVVDSKVGFVFFFDKKKD